MRAFLTDIVHLFLTLPFYVLLALVATSVAAFRVRARLHRWRYPLALLTIGVYLVSAPVFANAWRRHLEGLYPVPAVEHVRGGAAPIVMVLTAGWMRTTANGYEARIGEPGWERTAAAVRLWRRIGGKLIFIGAPNFDYADSAAAAMARVAQSMGVPASAILLETRSLNTHENFVFSKPLIPQGAHPIYVVTSALQMPRAYAVAKREGIDAIAYPCDFVAQARTSWQDWLPNNNGPAMLEDIAHELLGILAYRLRGWV